jgi:hypothetical protein
MVLCVFLFLLHVVKSSLLLYFCSRPQLEQALKYIMKALTNHRNAEYVSTQKALEREISERKRKAYLDPALAAEHKNKGNDLFKAGMYWTSYVL